eukprot:scaffold41671_cov46-Attheya_sp.AAC.1
MAASSLKFILWVGILAMACAFTPVRHAPKVILQYERFSIGLEMVPKFDQRSARWEPQTDEDGPQSGYGILGSLLRQGPLPFFQRVTSGDNYDQAVLKLMASEGLDRNEGQGSMDAYLNNPNDWAMVKLQENETGEKYDFVTVNMNPKQIGLTIIWACIVFAIVGRIIYVAATGGAPEYLYDITS